MGAIASEKEEDMNKQQRLSAARDYALTIALQFDYQSVCHCSKTPRHNRR